MQNLEETNPKKAIKAPVKETSSIAGKVAMLKNFNTRIHDGRSMKDRNLSCANVPVIGFTCGGRTPFTWLKRPKTVTISENQVAAKPQNVSITETTHLQLECRSSKRRPSKCHRSIAVERCVWTGRSTELIIFPNLPCLQLSRLLCWKSATTRSEFKDDYGLASVTSLHEIKLVTAVLARELVKLLFN